MYTLANLYPGNTPCSSATMIETSLEGWDDWGVTTASREQRTPEGSKDLHYNGEVRCISTIFSTRGLGPQF